MIPLTERDKKTLRLGSIILAVYLTGFFGFRVVRALEQTRSDFEKLQTEARLLKDQLRPYETKLLKIEKLRSTLKLEVNKLKRESLVADASAAIQRSAMAGGIMLGPIRESAARPSAHELTTMQLEAFGQPSAILGFLHQLETLGFPLLLDSVQVSQDPTKPGMTKLTLLIQVLDFDQWKNQEEGRHV